MNQKLKKILVLCAVLAVVFTNGSFGLFEDVNNTKQPQENAVGYGEYRVSVKQNSSVGLVEITTKPTNVSGLENCRLFSTSKFSKNYFQDQGILDLNQPSNCFNLSLGKIQPIAQNLEVKNLAQQKVNVVVLELPIVRISTNFQNSNLPEKNIIAVFSNYMLAFQEKHITIPLKTITVEQKSGIKLHLVQRTIEELQNFRC